MASTLQLQQHALGGLRLAGLTDIDLVRGTGSKARWTVRRHVVVVAQGRAVVSGHEVTLQVGLTRNFPYSPPIVRLVDSQAWPRAPHVEEDETVCFSRNNGRVIDRHEPEGIVSHALKEACNTLRRGWETDSTEEFMAEFAAYWYETEPEDSLASYLTVDDRLRRVHLALDKVHRTSRPDRRTSHTVAWAGQQAQRQQARMRASRRLRLGLEPVPKRGLRWVTDDADTPKAYTGSEVHTGHRTALYVPLAASARVLPPAPGERWSAAEVHALVRANLTPDNLRELDRLVGPCVGELVVILGVPAPGTRLTLVGLRYHGLKNHPLAERAFEPGRHVPTPATVTVRRLDRPYVMGRGGGRPQVTSKRVLILGCGAIGGHLATMLASAGVGHLTLLDHDRLSWENTYRHVLGRAGLGRRKVEALTRDLQARMPYLDVRAVPLTLDQAVSAGEVRLNEYDLVIAATGEPSVDLDLNARLQNLGQVPALFTWLEPFGVGGHALLTGLPTGGGCFECLYSSDADDEPLHNRAALYAPGQDFDLDLVGCGSFYTPFADLDARRTAEIAARLALDVLQDRRTENLLVTWKGDAAEFREAGFITSPRYEVSGDELLAGAPYAASTCPTCGGV